jgi:hypothetical protein
LSRPQENAWSRRRAAVKAEAKADDRAVEQAELAIEHAELEKKSDAEILHELNLQDPDEMKAGDDFTAFMKSAVPERIRRRALRKLWLSNPVLANVDHLVEYGEDFKAESIAGAVIKTAYQVGKGMLKHTDEMEKQAAKAKAKAEIIAKDAPEDEIEEIAEEAPQEDAVIVQAEYVSPLNNDIPEDTPEIHAKRRIRFAFEEAG